MANSHPTPHGEGYDEDRADVDQPNFKSTRSESGRTFGPGAPLKRHDECGEGDSQYQRNSGCDTIARSAFGIFGRRHCDGTQVHQWTWSTEHRDTTEQIEDRVGKDRKQQDDKIEGGEVSEIVK